MCFLNLDVSKVSGTPAIDANHARDAVLVNIGSVCAILVVSVCCDVLWCGGGVAVQFAGDVVWCVAMRCLVRCDGINDGRCVVVCCDLVRCGVGLGVPVHRVP